MFKYDIIFCKDKRGDFMCQYIFGQSAYDFFNTFAIIATVITSLFYFKTKRESLSLYSKKALLFASEKNNIFAKLVEVVLVLLETFILVGGTMISTLFNWSFGEMLNTGLNYFGLLFFVSVVWFLISVIMKASPLKQIDIATMFLPVHLFFIKLACFCNGCCWGVPWEHGPYNHHYDHPGNQVPVQAIEAGLAVVILVLLLIYRKKAKTGTLFPMYMILYSATRFPVEFFSAAHDKIIGPFNTYHILCVVGVVIGIIMLIFVKYFGKKITEFFETPHQRLDEETARCQEKV